MQADCDFKSNYKNRKKKKLKDDCVKIACVEFKNRLKPAVVVLWQTMFQGPNCHTELVKCRQHDNLSWQSILVYYTDKGKNEYL